MENSKFKNSNCDTKSIIRGESRQQDLEGDCCVITRGEAVIEEGGKEVDSRNT